MELAAQYGTPVQYDYSVERGRRDMGNHFFRDATKWSNNVAELTAMIQAMLEIEAAVEPPDQVWMFYDSTYASIV